MSLIALARRSTRRVAALGLVATLAALSACGGSTTSADAAGLRMLNASTAYSALDLYVDGTRDLASVASGALSGAVSLDAATYTVALRNAGGTTTLASSSQTLSASTGYTLVAYGSEGNLKMAVLTHTSDTPSSGSAKLRVLNAAPEAGAVDVYVSDSCATVTDFTSASSLTTSLAGGSASGFTTTGSGTLCLRVTGAGSTTDLRLAVPSLTLGSTEVTTIVLQPGPGGVLLNAIAIRQTDNNATALTNSSARVRLVASVADGASVAATVGSTTLSGGTASPAVGGYTLVSAGSPALAVSVNGTAVATSSLAASAGGDYTLLVTGSASAPTVKVITDDNRLPTGSANARLRVVHGSQALAGSALTMTVNYNAVATGVAFGSASTPTAVDASSSLGLDVTADGQTSAVYSNSDLTLAAQGVYTLFVLSNGSGSTAMLRTNR